MKRQASKALKHMRKKLLAAERQRERVQKKVLIQSGAGKACASRKRYGVPRGMGYLHAQARLAVEVHCRAIQRQQSPAATCSSTAYK